MSLSGGLTAGLVAGLTSRAMGGVSAWNPSRLTGLAVTLLPAESRSRGLLWQNTAETVPAVADGDPVRVAVCPYTGVKFTAPSDAARPLLWDEGGGKWSLSFDGVDDYLSSPNVAATGTQVVGVRFRNASSVSGVRLLVSLKDRLELAVLPTGGYRPLTWLYGGTNNTVGLAESTALDAGTYATAVISYAGGGPTVAANYGVVWNGTERTPTTGSNFGAPTGSGVGGRDGSAFFFAGRMPAVVVADASADAATRALLSTYLGAL